MNHIDLNNYESYDVADTRSLPFSNNPKWNIDPLQKDLQDSKTIGLDAIVQVIGKIHDTLDEEGTINIREHVRTLQQIHPNIDKQLINLKYFKPMSESVGAPFLAYTIDKSALPYVYWISPLPELKPLAVRQNIINKLDSATLFSIEAAYTSLNQKLASNISNEYLVEDPNNIQPAHNTSHAYHIVGDYLWYVNHINNKLPNKVLERMKESDPDFVDTIQLVNYLVINNSGNGVSNDVYDIKTEGQKITVDRRNNPVTKGYIGDTSAIKPTKELEKLSED